MGYKKYTRYDISIWNTENVTNMNGLFSKCSSLISLPDISKWNTKNVSNMDCIFQHDVQV